MTRGEQDRPPAEQTPLIVSFGCPRTGTTLMQHMLGQGRGYASRQVSLLNPLHPTRSANGLIGLLSMVDERCVIVRTRRNPMCVVESFMAIRPDPAPGSVNQASDEEIVGWIVAESENAATQREAAIRAGWADRWHEVAYEEMGNPAVMAKFLWRLLKGFPSRQSNRQALHEWMAATWGMRPVRVGALSKGLDRRGLLSDERRAWFGDRLREVALREGYE